MSAEFSSADNWIGAVVKGLSVIVSALFGWIWRTSHRQAKIEQKMANGDERLAKIEKGVGRILNHLTGTSLHDD